MRMSLVVGAVLAIGLVACGSDSTSGPITPSTIVGAYAATRFNGAAVPAAVLVTDPAGTDPTTWTLVSGTLELHADNTWAITYPMRFAAKSGKTGASNPVPHDFGTFTLAGTTLTLRDSTARSSFVADVSGSTVTMRAGQVSSFGFSTLEFSR